VSKEESKQASERTKQRKEEKRREENETDAVVRHVQGLQIGKELKEI
jgi:hypothetical protein